MINKLLAFVVSITCANAEVIGQFVNPTSHSLHLQLTYGNGSHEIVSSSLTHINKRGFSISYQATNESRNSKNVPTDFEPGWFVIFGDGIPNVSITTKSILAGKVLEDQSKLIRLNLQGGICYGIIERPINFIKKSRRSFFGSTTYYDYELQKNKFVGMILNPTMDIMISRIIALYTGIRANINGQMITYGAEFGLQIGYIRKRR